MSAQLRIDMLICSLGLAKSRTQAQKYIASGSVQANGAPIKKPSQLVSPDADIRIKKAEKEYVSRGAFKLLGALECFHVDPSGCICADIGASTGGFTQVLLEKGAARVYAIDCGTDQLDGLLKNDPRVISMEATNARYLSRDSLPEQVDLVVYDVSFISASLIYPGISSILKNSGIIIGLIKPQFEAGKAALNKNGIVKRPEDHILSILKCRDACETCGFYMNGITRSPIAGGDGNTEYLAVFSRTGPSVSRDAIIKLVKESR